MVDSNGYIMFDLSMLDYSKHNQVIDGIYQRIFEVIGSYKFVILLGVQSKTPLPACVSFVNGSYVIESFLYNFAITSDDNVRIENVSADIIKDGIISAGTTWSSSKIKSELDNVGVSPFIEYVDVIINFSISGYGSREIKGSDVTMVLPDDYKIVSLIGYDFNKSIGNSFIQSINVFAGNNDNFIVIKNPFTGSYSDVNLTLTLGVIDGKYVID